MGITNVIYSLNGSCLLDFKIHKSEEWKFYKAVLMPIFTYFFILLQKYVLLILAVNFLFVIYYTDRNSLYFFKLFISQIITSVLFTSKLFWEYNFIEFFHFCTILFSLVIFNVILNSIRKQRLYVFRWKVLHLRP